MMNIYNYDDFELVSLEVQPASYTIYISGNTINAANGLTGTIDYSGTDFSTVLQSVIGALPNGGRIFIKAGTYLISTTTTLTAGIILSGEGEATILQLANGANTDMFTTNPNSANYYITIRDLRFNGNYNNNTLGKGLHLYGAHFGRFENLFFREFAQEAIHMENGNTTSGGTTSQDNWFNNIYILHFKTTGMRASFLNDTFLININIGTSVPATGASLHWENGGPLMISNIHTWGSDYGIIIEPTASGYATVSGFYVETHPNIGLYVKGIFNTFTNGDVKVCGTAGIRLEGSNNFIDNTIVHDNTGDGIVIASGGAGNHFSNVQSRANLNGLKSADKAALVNCKFALNQQHGIWFESPAYNPITSSRIIGCESLRNSQSTANTYDGIYLNNVGQIIIMNCVLWDYAPSYQRYGINEAGTSDYNYISGCLIKDNVTGGYNLLGKHSQIINSAVNDQLVSTTPSGTGGCACTIDQYCILGNCVSKMYAYVGLGIGASVLLAVLVKK